MKTFTFKSMLVLFVGLSLSIFVTGCYPSDVLKEIKDPIFQKYLMEFDNNGDHKISKEEALMVNEMNIPQGVNQIDGIKYFKNLEKLICIHLGTEAIDLSSCHKLRKLNMNHMPNLERLKVNQEIEELELWSTNLESLNLGALPNLEKLSIHHFGANLVIDEAPNLKEISLDYTQLTSINTSKFPALESLRLSDNPILTTLDINHNPNLQELRLYNNPKLIPESIFQNSSLKKITIEFPADKKDMKLKLSINSQPNLETLNIECFEVDLANSEAPNLKVLNLEYAKATSLDLSRFPLLKVVSIPKNITTLDVSKNTRLEDINGSWFWHLKELKMRKGQSKALLSRTARDLYSNVQIVYVD